MTHPFDIELQTHLPATPEQVWDAIATGPGIDAWFMGRNKVEPRQGGTAVMETGGHHEEAEITAYEPGKRFATRTPTDEEGRTTALEYLIEGHDGGATVLRVVHSGILGDNWEEEYNALRRGWPFHLHTLREYLTHFPGRTSTPLFVARVPGEYLPAQRIRSDIARGLSLETPVTTGARAHAAPAGLPPLDGEVVWADDERIGIRTADGLYTFHNAPGLALMFHHLFAPDTDGAAAETAWRHWLTGLVG